MINNPQTLAKARAFWARKAELRRQPGRCGRCAKPNPDATHKHCAACREYAHRYKTARTRAPVVVEGKLLAALQQRVDSLEHAVASMQLRRREIRRRGYQSGRYRRAVAMRAQRYLDAYPQLTRQELSQISHGYAQETT